MNQEQTVFIVDDEPAVARAIARLLKSCGYTVQSFGSARDFMSCYKPETAGCVVADVSMPELNGLDLKQWMADSDNLLPIIFLTGFDDLTEEERRIMEGAVNILKKPVNPSLLLAAIDQALARDREARRARI